MIAPLELRDAAFRLGAATLIGAIIGLNRDLKHKPAGLRTHALVSLATAFIVELAYYLPADTLTDAGGNASRVIQGAITGIGFLGAGVILHRIGEESIHGLTTAATIWVTAAVGIACGAGYWAAALSTLAILLLVLLLGGPIERTVHRWLDRGPSSEPSSEE